MKYNKKFQKDVRDLIKKHLSKDDELGVFVVDVLNQFDTDLVKSRIINMLVDVVSECILENGKV